jgi:hypothetical protein
LVLLVLDLFVALRFGFVVLRLGFVWDLEIGFCDLGGASGGEGIVGGRYCTIGRTKIFELSFKLGNEKTK